MGRIDRYCDEATIGVLRDGELKMTLEQFHQSLSQTEPPAELTLALARLLWDAKGDWTRAQESAQQAAEFTLLSGTFFAAASYLSV